MKFAIRDDDTNYFTTPEALLRNYEPVWGKCPISLSVVPFHACTKSGSIPEKYWSGDKIFPIGENKELVQFLKEKIREGKVSITLHGYDHKDNPDGYEFETGVDLYDKVRQGKEYLEELLDVKIEAFVPPHNIISKEGLAAVVDNRLNLVNIPSFRFSRRSFRLGNIIPFIKLRAFHRKYKNRKYPYVLNFDNHFGNHKEVGYYSLTPRVSLESLKRDFDFCRKMGGSFILATHYWEFTAKQIYNQSLQMGDVFRDFWEYVSDSDDVNYVTVNQIFGG